MADETDTSMEAPATGLAPENVGRIGVVFGSSLSCPTFFLAQWRRWATKKNGTRSRTMRAWVKLIPRGYRTIKPNTAEILLCSFLGNWIVNLDDDKLSAVQWLKTGRTICNVNQEDIMEKAPLDVETRRFIYLIHDGYCDIAWWKGTETAPVGKQ